MCDIVSDMEIGDFVRCKCKNGVGCGLVLIVESIEGEDAYGTDVATLKPADTWVDVAEVIEVSDENKLLFKLGISLDL